ncbi:MAG: alpha/beta hydrolase [Bacillota bacterium]|nr:alpha/beta hydrolase [Bacillota bacterium]
MISAFMKKMGEKAYQKDLERIDLSKSDKSIIEIKDVSYVSDNLAEHTLDIYFRADNTLKAVLLDIHGGGFISGGKETDALFANFLAQRGFVVFCINYRLAYPSITVFDQIEDVSNAVNWIMQNAKEYEANTNDMYIVGHSAGGVLAVAEALLCNDKNMRADYKIAERWYSYQGICLDCGAMHFYVNNIAYWGMRNMVFPKGYRKMGRYPYLLFSRNNMTATLPKTILLTNKNDELKEMTYYFKDVLDRYRVENRLLDTAACGHMGIIFTPYTNENQRVLDSIREFFAGDRKQ